MATGFNDQANANRLALQVEGRFGYVDGFAAWWERMGDQWERWGAEMRLRESYIDLMSEMVPGSEREGYQRAGALIKTSQVAVLWILQRDSRFVKEPSEVCRPIYVADDWKPGDELIACARAYFPETDPKPLLDLFMRTRTHGEMAYQVFVRTTRSTADPDDLYPLLCKQWGERVVRLPLHIWRSWPEKLTPEWVLRLWGVWAVFLDAPEAKCKSPFPEEALSRLLRPEQEWMGHDGRFYVLPMPRLYILGGPPVNIENWEPALRQNTLAARPLFPAGDQS